MKFTCYNKIRSFINYTTENKNLAPYGTVVYSSERRRHLANVIAIAKAFAN